MDEKNDMLWEKGGFAETIGPGDMKAKMRTFDMKHDEDMDYGCRKCKEKISAHNRDWHAGLCDRCLYEMCYKE